MINDPSMLNIDCPHCGASLKISTRTQKATASPFQKKLSEGFITSAVKTAVYGARLVHRYSKTYSPPPDVRVNQGNVKVDIEGIFDTFFPFVSISDDGRIPCPKCKKDFELKDLKQSISICLNPSCKNTALSDLPFCQSCYRPFNNYSDIHKFSNIHVISTIEELHTFISVCGDIQVGVYVILENQISQNITKAWNQLKKRHGKVKRHFGDAVSSLDLDPVSLTSKAFKVFMDGQALQTDEKDAYYSVPLSREAEEIYNQGFEVKYNDGERVILKKEL